MNRLRPHGPQQAALGALLLLALLGGTVVWNGVDGKRKAEEKLAQSGRDRTRSSGQSLPASALSPGEGGHAWLDAFRTTAERSMDRNGLAALESVAIGSTVKLAFPGFAAVGKVQNLLVEKGVRHWTVLLDNGKATFTASVRDDGMLLADLRFLGVENGLRLKGVAGKPDLEVSEVPYWKTVCTPRGTVPGVGSAFGLGVGNLSYEVFVPSPGPLTTPVPALNSLVGAYYTIYLDFDGEVVNHPLWNINGQPIAAAAHPNAANTVWVTNVWKRVAEDFVTFAVNVTTSRASYDATPPTRRMMCVVTPTNTAAPGMGGAAFLCSYPFGVPCWCFNLDEYTCADTISHEVGHTLGLDHDGRRLVPPLHDDYYGGHGTGAVSWAPIMGAAWSDEVPPVFLENLTQWSRGEYVDANNEEDDLAIIASSLNGFGWRLDDKGSTRETASALRVTGTVIQDSGIIERESDQDWMRFNAGPGILSVFVTPLQVNSAYHPSPGGNLAVSLRLYDEAGSLLQESNDPTTLAATITRSVAQGVYYISVAGAGRGTAATGFTKYASLGQYNVTGNTVDGTPPPPPPDTVDPVVFISTPGPGASGTAAVSVAGAASDNVGVAGVEVRLNGGTWKVATGSLTWSATVTLVAGDNVIEARARDTSGRYSLMVSRLVSFGSAAPEIVVEQPAGTPLRDAIGSVSFGSGTVGTSRIKTFTIRNTGTGNLAGLAFSFAGANPGDFSVTSPGSSVIGPGASITVNTTMIPLASGQRNATLLITSNDADENPFRVALSGTGLPLANPTYSWSNYAGLPGGLGSSNGTGRNARFAFPSSVALDASGNIYVADTENHVIRKMTPAGSVTLLAGSAGNAGSADGAGTVARFNGPRGLDVGATGMIYVADTGNNTIRRVTPSGVVSTVAGRALEFGETDGPAIDARFSSPSGIAVDASGLLYVADTLNHTVRRIAADGLVTTLAGIPGVPGSDDGTQGAATFYNPSGMDVDSAGQIFVTDTYNHTIRKITPAGTVFTVAGSPGEFGDADGNGPVARFNSPSGISVDAAGNLWVADTFNQVVRKITASGMVSTWAGSSGLAGSLDGEAGAARFANPTGIAAAIGGILYVVDDGNHALRRVSAEQFVSTVAGNPANPGSLPGSGTAARFLSPGGVAADSSGNLFVADTGNHLIRRINPADETSTLAGLAEVPGNANGTGGSARFSSPFGIAVAPDGTITVADADNHTIRRVTLAGVVTSLAGSAGNFGSVNGAAASARFNTPLGMAYDAVGNLFIADSGNHTIRRLSTNGQVTTVAGLAGIYGSADGLAGDARFHTPSAVVFDAAGNLCIADAGNHTIRKLTPAGMVETLAGSVGTPGHTDGTGSAARFWNPRGIAADAGGFLYVTSSQGQTVRRISPAGAVITIGGSGGQASGADGPGVTARFSGPTGLAVRPSGVVVVVDTGNHRLTSGFPLGAGATLPPMTSWRLLHFGTTDDTGDASIEADPDHDGFSNLMEFALNGRPHESSQALLPQVGLMGRYFIVRYTRRTDALLEGLEFRVEWSQSMAATEWSTLNVAETVLSDDGLTQDVEVTVPATEGRMFLRVIVSQSQ